MFVGCQASDAVRTGLARLRQCSLPDKGIDTTHDNPEELKKKIEMSGSVRTNRAGEVALTMQFIALPTSMGPVLPKGVRVASEDFR